MISFNTSQFQHLLWLSEMSQVNLYWFALNIGMKKLLWLKICYDTLKCVMTTFAGTRYLKREQAKILNPQNQNNLRSLMLCIVEWRLLFAISQFWRLKFEGNPLVDYKWKLIFKVLNDFTQRLSLQKSSVTLIIT